MKSSRNRLYSLLFAACLAGYGWIYYASLGQNGNMPSAEVCLVKHATSVPCPSYGTTRSILSIAEGDLIQALLTNPLGYIGAAFLVVVPVWIGFDVFVKRATLHKFYLGFETMLKRPRYALPFAFLIIVNWLWNIFKGL